MAVDPAAALRRHGWEVELEEAEGHVWASLVAIENPDFVVRRYGRGDDAVSAIARAWRRYEVEQIGGPAQR